MDLVLDEAHRVTDRETALRVVPGGRRHGTGAHPRKGVLKGLGFKAGRWVDVVTMQRPLNVGSATLGPGIDWGGG